MFKYIKTAFLNRWNLLLLGGGMAAAAISGHFDVVASLVAAAEVAYLGFLGTHPTFRNYVDVSESKSNRNNTKESVNQLSRRMLAELPKPLVDRFDQVRTRCENLRGLASSMQGPGVSSDPGALEEYQIEGLDKLLWMYLRMLYTRFSVAKFLKQTSPSGIQRDIEESQARLAALEGRGDDPNMQRRRSLLEDNLKMSRNRLENYKKAEENFELMGLELERLENTIHSLSELAVTRQEPRILSDQIGEMAESMVATEKAMGELQFATGLEVLEGEVPQLLRSEVVFNK